MSRRLAPLATLVVCLWSPSEALACKCVATSFEAARDAAAAVFEGVVTGVAPEGDRRLRVRLRLVRVWKGDENVEQVELHTPSSSAACGVSFREGEGYLVFAQSSEGELSANLCSRTRRSEDAGEDLAALGVGVTPVQLEDTPEPEATAAPASSEVEGGGFAHCQAAPARHGEAPPIWLWAAACLAVAWLRLRVHRT